MSKQPTISQNLQTATATLIRALHSTAFPDALSEFLKAVVPFDHLVVFRYFQEKAPEVLSHNFDIRFSVSSLNTYLSGPYLLDPFFEVCRDSRAKGVIHLKDIAPDQFFRSEYYRTYYITTRIIDEIGVFVPMPDGSVIVATIERMRGNRAFRKKEIDHFRDIESIVHEAVIKNWCDAKLLIPPAHSADDTIGTLSDRVKTIASIDGRPGLTNRESEIVSFILRGYSSIAIASILDISAATVKVHRKNIYSKLKISSQAELFSLFMPLLSQAAA